MAQGFAPPSSTPLDTTTKTFKRSIIEELQVLDDPRTKRKPQHLLIDILTITILAVISGADGMVAVETYGKRKQQWLETFLELPYGIPSHDTFSRVLALIDPQQMHECFLSWVNHLSDKLDINVISIDGKTSRGSYDRNKGIKALHTVSAWASEHRLVLAQQAVEDKSNEITAIPELLELLDISGAIITIDAMGTQKKIAAQIVAQGGDYILSLKGNHKNLHKDVKAFFKQAQADGWQGIDYSYTETTESGHHRQEHRQVWAVSIDQCPALRGAKQWKGFTTIVMIRRERHLWNKTTIEICYYISSLGADATALAEAIRSHWGIENSLHWVLDVTFGQDASRIRTGHGPENMAVLQHLCLNLLQQEPSKQSLAMKRYSAALDHNFALKVLCGQDAA